MRHKKNTHGPNVKICDKFVRGNCPNSDEQCWYRHISSQSGSPLQNEIEYPPIQSSSLKTSSPRQQQVFQQAPANNFPPDQMVMKMVEAVNKLCTRIEVMERRIEELMI